MRVSSKSYGLPDHLINTLTRHIDISLLLLLVPASLASTVNQDANAKQATCTKDEILILFEDLSVLAKPFCSIFTKVPQHTSVPIWARPWTAIPAEISSACTCLNSVSTTSTSSTPTPTSASSSMTSTISSTSTTSSTTTTSSSSSVSTPSSSTTSPSATTSNVCTVTQYAALPAATANCTNIVIKDVTVPGNSTLSLAKLKTGTKVTFAGFTTFEYANADYDLIDIGGTNIEITAEPDAIIDGNGQAWWDGQGSNGGILKPDHFITVSKALGSSSIHDLYIQNYPTHCFDITNCAGLSVYNIVLNNTAGNAPNNRSDGLPAAHNTDGFDVSSCNNTIIRDSTVLNQDDCVAITSGNNVTVDNLYCDGGHGLSIGSVGGKSNNNVTNILFENSVVINSQNGPRIKTNYNTTGFIANVTYANIFVSNASIYGIDIQQDYLNGGPTGIPSNGVIITNITMDNVTGTADGAAGAADYYILCGNGSCSNFLFEDVNIVGGTNDSCNVQTSGGFTCL